MSGGEDSVRSLVAGLLRVHGSDKHYIIVRLVHQFVRCVVVLHLNGAADYRTMGGVLLAANGMAIARARSIARAEETAWQVKNGAVVTAVIFDMEDEEGGE